MPMLAVSATLVITFVAFLSYNIIYIGKIYPGVKIAGLPMSGLTPKEAVAELSENISLTDNVILFYQNSPIELELSTIEFSYDIPASAETAYKLHRTGNIIVDILNRLRSPTRSEDLPINISFDENKLLEYLAIISDELGQEPVYPVAKTESDTIIVNRGNKGTQVNIELLKSNIVRSLELYKNDPVEIPFITLDPTISESEAKYFKERAKNFIGKKAVLTTDDQSFKYEGDKLLKLIDPTNNYSERDLLTLIKNVSAKVDRPPENAVFVFQPTQNGQSNNVIEFSPESDGLKVEELELLLIMKDALADLENNSKNIVTSTIPLLVTTPEITLDSINNLGIKELLGKGTSEFIGSIAPRMFNIGHAASKFKGVLIPPGEIFSFNEILGDVSEYTGYKKAYIIKDGRTVLGDGGGVCQVSTTLFRAVLNSGLPIEERRAHSYRVSYYEQDSLPGLDATVYAPYTDLKAKNDTPGYLLIQTNFDPTAATLAFEIYGTSDGRTATISKPIITNTSAPPEDLYVDDPTLPSGTVKQIDYKAWGANVYFDYQVEKSGEATYKKTFYSNFRPWQAVYLRGTGPVN